ncbi:hypothetical protein [Yersinia ruckeri]|uniref:hypothetical protein n=1 Tax=Yersinia ruckeri TaxID=29486 RepID=UPI00223884AD|nr:hypothetical protein [Yersinia ruckeri]MCW6598616.1 hypothetical protein [Yersinia ruckeri]
MVTAKNEFQDGLFDTLSMEELEAKRKDCAPFMEELLDSIIASKKKKAAAATADPTLDYLNNDMELLTAAQQDFGATWLKRDKDNPDSPLMGSVVQPVILMNTFIRADVMDALMETGLEREVMFGQGLVIKNARLIGLHTSLMRELIAGEVDSEGNKRYNKYEGTLAFDQFPRKMRDGNGIWRIKDPALEQQFIECGGKGMTIEDDQWGAWEYHMDRCGFMHITYDKISYEQEANILKYMEKQNLVPEGYQIVSGLDDLFQGYRYALCMPSVEVDDPWEETDKETGEVTRGVQKTNAWTNKIGVVMGSFQLMSKR